MKLDGLVYCHHVFIYALASGRIVRLSKPAKMTMTDENTTQVHFMTAKAKKGDPPGLPMGAQPATWEVRPSTFSSNGTNTSRTEEVTVYPRPGPCVGQALVQYLWQEVPNLTFDVLCRNRQLTTLTS